MRIVGGTGALVEAIADRLPKACLLRSMQIRQMELAEDGVVIHIAGDNAQVFSANQVIAALPLRLLAAVDFNPALDEATFGAGGRLPHRWLPTRSFLRFTSGRSGERPDSQAQLRVWLAPR